MGVVRHHTWVPEQNFGLLDRHTILIDSLRSAMAKEQSNSFLSCLLCHPRPARHSPLSHVTSAAGLIHSHCPVTFSTLLKGNSILSIKRDFLHPLGVFSHFAIPWVDTFSIAILLEIDSDNTIDARRNGAHTRKGPGPNTVQCSVKSTSSREYFTRTRSMKPVTKDFQSSL